MVIRGLSPSPSTRRLVTALRERDPAGMEAVYDNYAESLYEYSWWLLRDRGTAWEALHDALLAASVHVRALRRSGRLRPWLYALVRAECLRRPPKLPGIGERAEAAGGIPQDGTEPHALAWKAIESIPAVDADALVLHVRHEIELADLATILGTSAREMRHRLQRARTRVEQALRTEILARTGPGDCTEVAVLLQALAEHPTAQGYARVDLHARRCSTCAPRVPRHVSLARLMEALPTVRPPDDLRVQVSQACADPRLEDYRSLAARRLQPLGRAGFPRSGRESGRRSARTVAAVTAGGVLASVAFVGLAGLGYVGYTAFSGETRSAPGHGGQGGQGGQGTRPAGGAGGRIEVATPSPTAGRPPGRPVPAPSTSR